MAEQKKKRRWLFPLCMFLYAVIFLGLTAWGLDVLWDYVDQYERSRPEYAMDAYMEDFDTARVFEGDTLLRSQLNEQLEPEQMQKEEILSRLSSGVDYLARDKESSEGKKVYALVCEGIRVGTVTLVHGGKTNYGFTPWAVESETFELPYPVLPGVEYTIPQGYTMVVNGHELGEEYKTREGVHYETYGDMYELYTLPTQNTYAAGPFLVEPEVSFLDTEGNTVKPEDFQKVLDNCTEEDKQMLQSFTEDFVGAYVAYTGSTNSNRYANFGRLWPFLMDGTDFKNRAYEAMYGLTFGQTYSNTIKEVTLNLCTVMEDGRYYVDVTYLVETVGKKGPVDVLSNARLIVNPFFDHKKVEELYRY